MKIGQRAQHVNPRRVLHQPPVTHLDESEHLLDDVKRMLDACPHLRLRTIAAPLGVAQRLVARALAIREVPSVRRLAQHPLALAAIGAVAPHPRFCIRVRFAA